MNINKSIPFIQSSSCDDPGVSLSEKEMYLKDYINLVNRITLRITEQTDKKSNFDFLSLCGVP